MTRKAARFHSLGEKSRLEAAQVILGHASADVTQIYAESDREKAIAVMERVG